MKKDINGVKLSKEEMSTALSKSSNEFAPDEIYKYSRPDSVINYYKLYEKLTIFPNYI